MDDLAALTLIQHPCYLYKLLFLFVAVGWIMALSSIVMIPLLALINIFVTPGSFFEVSGSNRETRFGLKLGPSSAGSGSGPPFLCFLVQKHW